MAELERRKAEQIREEKLIQRIREESAELRELESKLKAAYVSKERATQMAEREARVVSERVRLLCRDVHSLEVCRMRGDGTSLPWLVRAVRIPVTHVNVVVSLFGYTATPNRAGQPDGDARREGGGVGATARL